MKKLALAISILAICENTLAGSVAGFGGSTEVTQILNNIQLVQQYEQQIQQFVVQGQQLDAQLKNLMANPNSAMPTQITGMIQKIGGMMSAGNSMGGSLSAIDAKFATTFSSPLATTYSQQFTNLTQVSKDTLQASMRTAGLQRDQYSSDTNAIQALYAQSQSTNGTLDSLQTLSQINIQNVQQLQGMKDLMATQNIASSTWMASQASKDKMKQDAQEINFSMPTPRTTTYQNPTF